MIRYSPSNVRKPDGTPTDRDACAGENCYCVEGEADCLLATIPAGSTEELRDVQTNTVIVDTGSTTSAVALYADVDNPWAFNVGVRAVFNVSAFGAFNVSLTADAQLAQDSDNMTGANPRIVRAVLCVDEFGTVTAWAEGATDTGTYAVFAQLTGYAMTNNRNFAGVSGNSYADTRIDHIQTTARPECPPCPDPPAQLNVCVICGPTEADKPANLQLTFSGWGGGDPASPCHPDDVCSQLNGTYTVPNLGAVQPCCYRLDFQIPTNNCIFTSNAPGNFGQYTVRGFCIFACIVENPPQNPTQYKLTVSVSAYGRYDDPPALDIPFECFDDDPNSPGQELWLYSWDDNVFFDPAINPCNTIDHTVADLTSDAGTLEWIDNDLNVRRCTDFAGITPVRIEAA